MRACAGAESQLGDGARDYGQAKYYLGRTEETEPHIREAFRLSPYDSMDAVWMFLVGTAKLQLARSRRRSGRMAAPVDRGRAQYAD